jgi:hypothetical protein
LRPKLSNAPNNFGPHIYVHVIIQSGTKTIKRRDHEPQTITQRIAVFFVRLVNIAPTAEEQTISNDANAERELSIIEFMVSKVTPATDTR